jgi:hypothetical protein
VHLVSLELEGDTVSVALELTGRKEDLTRARSELIGRSEVLGLRLD